MSQSVSCQTVQLHKVERRKTGACNPVEHVHVCGYVQIVVNIVSRKCQALSCPARNIRYVGGLLLNNASECKS
jgi:hypothetical protein